MGMHSGPVTGGVLRGQNARFQLFGDTMNKASRMESTGLRERIQMSATTAQLLIDAGKEKWVEKRSQKVEVKGIGLQETYFFKQVLGRHTTTSVAGSSADGDTPNTMEIPDKQTTAMLESLGKAISSKTQRLITWNTEVLSRRVKAIVQHREDLLFAGIQHVELSQKVGVQLHKYVHDIAFMYRDNPFHNYEVRTVLRIRNCANDLLLFSYNIDAYTNIYSAYLVCYYYTIAACVPRDS